MALKLITPPAIYPLTDLEVQEHLKLSDDELLALSGTIERLIAAATEYAEDIAWRALITQTWDYFLAAWPAGRYIEIPKPPLQSAEVYYTPDGEAEEEFEDFLVDTDSEPGRVILEREAGWPSDTLSPSNPVRIRFVAGYGDAASNIPIRLKQAMLLHITSNYDGVNLRSVIENILINYRIVRW